MQAIDTTAMFGYFREEIGQHRYYVYVLFRPDLRPFYVGKGSGKRVLDHEREAKKNCPCWKCRTMRKIWRNGGEVSYDIVFGTNSEQEAYWIEARLIQQWRHLLTNIDDYDRRGSRTLSFSKLKRKKRTKEQEHERRVNRALTMIDVLDRRLTQAFRRNRTKEIERLEVLIEAYELWLSPPIQLRLFD